MKTNHRARLALLTALLFAAFAGTSAFAQDRRERDFDRGGPPVRLDQRYHHDHYYPTRGYAFAVLPRDSVRIGFRGGDYYYHAGVWFHPEGGRFIVAAPPFGVIVPVLPPAYATINVGGAPYYYANGVYYAPAPGQGYVVVQPPPGAETDGDDPAFAAAGPQQPSYDPQQGQPYGPQQPYAPPQPYAPQAANQPRASGSGDPVVYPRNNQPPPQVEADKTDCFRWATQNSVGSSAPVFQRAFAACMDGRGYSCGNNYKTSTSTNHKTSKHLVTCSVVDVRRRLRLSGSIVQLPRARDELTTDMTTASCTSLHQRSS